MLFVKHGNFTLLRSARRLKGPRFKRDPSKVLQISDVCADKLKNVFVLNPGSICNSNGSRDDLAVIDADNF